MFFFKATLNIASEYLNDFDIFSPIYVQYDTYGPHLSRTSWPQSAKRLQKCHRILVFLIISD